MSRSTTSGRPLAVWYEHPEWFRPLFAELDRRAIPHAKLNAGRARYDPADRTWPHALVFNRMSPSAHLRGHAAAIFHTTHFLEHLERLGVHVINGVEAWRTEISKARQLALFERIGVAYPRARVIDDPSLAPAAADGLRFPVVVKPNVGGSGAGIRRFDGPDDLERAVEAGGIDLGLDRTGLVQEFVSPGSGRIVRVEMLAGRLLYAIRVPATGDDFNLCPADLCGPDDAGGGPGVEAYDPPDEVVEQVRRILEAGGIEIGGVEYVIDREGRPRFYDVNALSNFVADAPRVVGFDPFATLVDWLEERLATAGAAAMAGGR